MTTLASAAVVLLSHSAISLSIDADFGHGYNPGALLTGLQAASASMQASMDLVGVTPTKVDRALARVKMCFVRQN